MHIQIEPNRNPRESELIFQIITIAAKLLEHKPIRAIDMAKGSMEIESSVDTRAPLRIGRPRSAPQTAKNLKKFEGKSRRRS